ncbi:MAG: carbonic anhydrase [Acidobacteriota bacterium]|nr:carbonic anhydrase [Acidobacteriota bacterium]
MQNPRRRRALSGIVAILVIWGLLVVKGLGPAHAAAPPSSPSPADALKLLLEGNQRFAEGKPVRPNQDTARRVALAGGQQPFAAILSCSDSRIPPEIIFDRGLGGLFIVRNAGNVAGPLAVESLHFATAHLGTRLVLVLGHTKCGAVAATLSGQTEDIPETAKEIEPAVAKSKSMSGDALDNAILENVRLTVQKLSTLTPLAEMVKAGDIQIVGAVYHLDSGRVIMLDSPAAAPTPSK